MSRQLSENQGTSGGGAADAQTAARRCRRRGRGRGGAAGSAPAGQRRASRLVDIAEAVGVHTSTVSRVLNGDPAQSVRPEIYQQILTTARQQGYRPNALARGAEAAPDRRVRVRRPAAAQPDLGPAAARGAAAGRRARLRRHDHGGAGRRPPAAGGLPVPGRREPGRRPADRDVAAGHRARRRRSGRAARLRQPPGPAPRQQRRHGRARRGAAVHRSRRRARPPQRLHHRRPVRGGHRAPPGRRGQADLRRPRDQAHRAARGGHRGGRLGRRPEAAPQRRRADGLRCRQPQPAVRGHGRAARGGRRRCPRRCRW